MSTPAVSGGRQCQTVSERRKSFGRELLESQGFVCGFLVFWLQLLQRPVKKCLARLMRDATSD